MSTTIKLRRGASTAFSTNNPTLQAGEPAFETDTGKLKIGDGTTAYNNLDYIGAGLQNSATDSTSIIVSDSGTYLSKTHNVVIGNSSYANGDYSVIIGQDSHVGTSSHIRNYSTIVGAKSYSDDGNSGIVLGYNSGATTDSITIGNNITKPTYTGSISIKSRANGQYAIAIGQNCSSTQPNSVAIGTTAKCQAQDAVQLGSGTNSTATTLQFRNYQLVDSSGKIPNDRLNMDSAPTAASTNTVSSDGVSTALSGKADTDLANVTDSAKVMMSGMGIPSSTYENLTLGASGSTYTAPANGYFCVAKASGGTNQYLDLRVNTLQITVYYDSGMVARNFIPVKKGETVMVSYNMTGNTEFFRFIYAVGSESEYTPASNS